MRMRGPVAAFITKKSDLCKSLCKYLCFRVSIVAQMAFAGPFGEPVFCPNEKQRGFGIGVGLDFACPPGA